MKESFLSELRKELKFVFCSKETVKQLKASSEEDSASAEEIVLSDNRKSKTPNGIKKHSTESH